MNSDDEELRRRKKLLEEELEKLKDIADVAPDSDIPVTEKKTKEDISKE